MAEGWIIILHPKEGKNIGHYEAINSSCCLRVESPWVNTGKQSWFRFRLQKPQVIFYARDPPPPITPKKFRSKCDSGFSKNLEFFLHFFRMSVSHCKLSFWDLDVIRDEFRKKIKCYMHCPCSWQDILTPNLTPTDWCRKFEIPFRFTQNSDLSIFACEKWISPFFKISSLGFLWWD